MEVKSALEDLKEKGEAPEWMTEESYTTISNGYLLKGETPKESYIRCSNFSAKVYKEDREKFEKDFLLAIWNNWLCPASPILSNANTKNLQISCYSGVSSDSLIGIMDHLKEMAMLTKYGGGVGSSFDKLRATGSKINSGGTSSGIVPFLKILDTVVDGVKQGSCYDETTEILTNSGWKLFKNLTELDKVAQVCTKTREITFIIPKEIIKIPYSGKMYHFISGKSKNHTIDLLVTPNHRMVLETMNSRNNKWAGELKFRRADETNMHRDNSMHTSGYTNSEKLFTAADQFRIAFQADGVKRVRKTKDVPGYTVLFRFSKERKIIRLKSILDKLNIEYNFKTTTNGVKYAYLKGVSEDLLYPTFSWVDLNSINTKWGESFIEEIGHWDGSIKGENVSYVSTVEENVEKIQAIAALCGKRSKIRHIKESETRKKRFFISLYKRPRVSGDSFLKTNVVDYSGDVYCCEVDTGAIIVRRNKAVVICGNSRRGAVASYLNIKHGDAEEFINIRSQTGDLSRKIQSVSFHNAITIDDEIMSEISSKNGKWRKQWNNIMNNRVQTGEPYVMFTGNANKNCPEEYKGTITQSNLCSEIMAPVTPEETFVCCLSSLNLAKYREWETYIFPNTGLTLVELSIYFLDAVISNFIDQTTGLDGLQNARRFAERHRMLGLGVLGWHTFLQTENLAFESFSSMSLNNKIFKQIREESYKASYDLAKKYGPCEVNGERRNAALLAIAPTMSNSLLSGGVSQGIEPITANSYSQKSAKGIFIRKNRQLEIFLRERNLDTQEVWEQINKDRGSVKNIEKLSEEEKRIFLTAREINQYAIIQQASQRQIYVDQAQSLNLFFSLPNSKQETLAVAKYINQVHLEAWNLGIKSLYYLKTESPLKGDTLFVDKDSGDCLSCQG